MKLENISAREKMPGSGDKAAGGNRAVLPTPVRAGRCARASVARRTTSARLFAMLDDDQIRALERIARGFELRTRGLGLRTQSFSSLPRGGVSSEDRQFILMQRFTVWAEAVCGDGLSLAAILDVVAFGKSCRTVDKERRKRNGYARTQLFAGLDLYRRLEEAPLNRK